jgi:uncharacterized protein with PIN domain
LSRLTACAIIWSMKFLADNMLGRLATWLRLLGYDTAYLPTADDHELARVARAEDRILLTRDVELTRRRGVRYLLIESEKVSEQLRQVFPEFHLTARAAFSRCAECNVVLESVSKDQVREQVPPYVLQTQTRFLRCHRCGKVYWRGTHWARIVAQIEDLDESDSEGL